MAVFVLDKRKCPLMPCGEKRARLLLERGRARVHRQHLFTIRLTDRVQSKAVLQPLRLTIDPGSKATGLALARESSVLDQESAEPVVTRDALILAELQHRGQLIRDTLTQRRAFRRRRRGANLHHRAPRFENRTRPNGWLAPSLRHRVDTTRSWVRRFRNLAPITAVSQELVRFDTQAMQNPEIGGIEYQQGTLFGCKVREYLLEKWQHKCAYCDAQQVPLEIEHIVARSRGGSDRVSNLTLACVPCNRRKNNGDVRDFLAVQPERLKGILAQAKAPLRDAAAVNSTRWALFETLKRTGLPVETASGGRTKWNRSRLGVPKTHALDALCVGKVDAVTNWRVPVLAIKATGRGSYQRTRLTAHGFPRGYLTRQKAQFGFQTGDMVRAVVPAGIKAGVHTGRVAVRASGSFNIQTPHGVIQGISHRHVRVTQRANGYGYEFVAQQPKEIGNRGHAARAALSLSGLSAGASRANR